MLSTAADISDDGINPAFLHCLATPNRKTLRHLSLRIPHTVLIEFGVPRVWFLNSHDGTVIKKNHREVRVDEIVETFSQGCAPHDICGVVLTIPPPQYESRSDDDSITTSVYVNRESLIAFLRGELDVREKDLKKRKKTDKSTAKRYLLQRFEDPMGWYNTQLKATWSPRLTMVEGVRCSESLKDHWRTESERGETFEAVRPISIAISELVNSAVKAQCNEIAQHMAQTFDVEMQGMLLYFKINKGGELLFLFSGSLRAKNRRSDALTTYPLLPADSPELSHDDALRTVTASPTVSRDNNKESPLNIWHQIRSFEQAHKREAFEKIVAAETLDKELCELEQRNRRVSLVAVSKSPPRATVGLSIVNSAEASPPLYADSARRFGIPIPACLQQSRGQHVNGQRSVLLDEVMVRSKGGKWAKGLAPTASEVAVPNRKQVVVLSDAKPTGGVRLLPMSHADNVARSVAKAHRQGATSQLGDSLLAGLRGQKRITLSPISLSILNPPPIRFPVEYSTSSFTSSSKAPTTVPTDASLRPGTGVYDATLTALNDVLYKLQSTHGRRKSLSTFDVQVDVPTDINVALLHEAFKSFAPLSVDQGVLTVSLDPQVSFATQLKQSEKAIRKIQVVGWTPPVDAPPPMKEPILDELWYR